MFHSKVVTNPSHNHLPGIQSNPHLEIDSVFLLSPRNESGTFVWREPHKRVKSKQEQQIEQLLGAASLRTDQRVVQFSRYLDLNS
jgi:hypothetical protein